MTGVLGLALPLAACTNSGCEETISRTVMAVEGVESVEAVCRSDINSSTSSAGAVHLVADNEKEAEEIVEQIEEAMARDPEIEDDWSGPSVVYLKDGTWFGTGNSEMKVVRERLGIEP